MSDKSEKSLKFTSWEVVRRLLVACISFVILIGIITLSFYYKEVNRERENFKDREERNVDILKEIITTHLESVVSDLVIISKIKELKEFIDIDSETNRGALAKYEYDKLKIQGEFLARRQEQIPGLNDKDADGWYIMTAYHFLPKLQAAIRYEQYDPDRDISRDRKDILTLGLNYFVNAYLKLQANYLFKDEQTEVGNNEFTLQLQIKY